MLHLLVIASEALFGACVTLVSNFTFFYYVFQAFSWNSRAEE